MMRLVYVWVYLSRSLLSRPASCFLSINTASKLQAYKISDLAFCDMRSGQYTTKLELSSPECKCRQEDAHYVDGFYICSQCGVAQDVHIDTGPEWRIGSANGSTNVTGTGIQANTGRCGEVASPLMPGTQLNTYIGKGGSARQQRVHQWYNVSLKERNMYKIYNEFQQVAAAASMSNDIVVCAVDLYRKLEVELESRNAGIKRCNVRQGLKAACVYYACKRLHRPRERKDIALMFDSTSKVVTRGCNMFLDVMGDEFINMDPVKPCDFLGRFCQLLGITYPDEMQIVKVITAVETMEVMSDNTPTGIAAGCIFFYSVQHNIGLNKVAIRDKCGISQTIVSRVYVKLCANREHILALVDKLDK